MSALDDIDDAITSALEDHPVADVLSRLTGHFVGLVVELVRRNGGGGDAQIHIDGGPSRDITIHATKEAPQ